MRLRVFCNYFVYTLITFTAIINIVFLSLIPLVRRHLFPLSRLYPLLFALRLHRYVFEYQKEKNVAQSVRRCLSVRMCATNRCSQLPWTITTTPLYSLRFNFFLYRFRFVKLLTVRLFVSEKFSIETEQVPAREYTVNGKAE